MLFRSPAIWPAMVLMASQIWTFSFLAWSNIWDWDVPASGIGHTFRMLALALVLVALLTFVGVSIPPLRKLLQRPHPFVEMSC